MISLNIKRFVLGNIESNCYILYDNQKAIIIDPGFKSDELKAFIKNEQLKIDGIYLTHGHFDHIGASNDLRDFYQTKVYAHQGDLIFLSKGTHNPWGEETVVDVWIEDKMTLDLMDHMFLVIHTPGHSPGGTVLHCDGIIISGDTLFYQSIGRTDLPYANTQTLYQSIQKLYDMFDDDIIVYPGHGRHTTIGHEKLKNPFVRAK